MTFVVVISPKRRADPKLWLMEQVAHGPFATKDAAAGYAKRNEPAGDWQARVVPLVAVATPLEFLPLCDQCGRGELDADGHCSECGPEKEYAVLDRRDKQARDDRDDNREPPDEDKAC